jgi:hypothetical protein
MRITMLLMVGAAACIYQRVEVKSVNPRATTSVSSPVRAHLADGSTIVFQRGVSVLGDNLSGQGFRYAPGSSRGTSASAISLDSVVGMEVFETETQVGQTIIASTLATALGAVAVVGLSVAIFGSCPTMYSDSAGVPVLEAEAFSYSIAPLFEQRDVHRLRAVPSSDGVLTLEVRNEALETHYINQLELLDVRHSIDEYVAPDNKDLPLALRRLAPAARAIDRAGRDVAPSIARTDGDLFATDSTTLASARSGDLDDYIDLEIPNPTHADTVALLFRMRNSLLNTVLLYDQILGQPGLRSLDWIGRDIKRIAPAVEMGRWYSAHMGMRVAVRDGGKYKRVGHIGDTGPIAFHEVAFLLPVPRGEREQNVHVRLSFVADQWRIDQIQVATMYRRPSFQTVPASEVVTRDPAQRTNARRDLRDADARYVVTSPTQSFKIRFNVDRGDGSPRTFLLASQGYYMEWVRGSWIKSASGKPFRTTDEPILAALNRWRTDRLVLERQFYSTRLATR